jgi:hypothetical protein
MLFGNKSDKHLRQAFASSQGLNSAELVTGPQAELAGVPLFYRLVPRLGVGVGDIFLVTAFPLIARVGA